jgi:hypothetical protein
MDSEANTQETQSEQLLYARVLEIGMYIGLVILFVTYRGSRRAPRSDIQLLESGGQ